MITVISLGGSLIAPDDVDTAYIKEFTALVDDALSLDEARKFIIVTGGGGTARRYQKAFFDTAVLTAENGVAQTELNESADWIGIAATRLNGEFVRQLLRRHCPQDVVCDPSAVSLFQGRVLVAAGWKPGFSSDNDAVILAERFGAKTVINLSNIERVYTADPKSDPNAKPLDSISWKDFRVIVGDKWTPGANLPFDPVASKFASEHKIKVIFAAGRPLDNLKNILYDMPFTGTKIG